MSKILAYWIVIFFLIILVIFLYHSPFIFLPLIGIMIFLSLVEIERKTPNKDQPQQKKEEIKATTYMTPKEYTGKHEKTNIAPQNSFISHNPYNNSMVSTKSSSSIPAHKTSHIESIKYEPVFDKSVIPLKAATSKAQQASVLSSDEGYIQYIMSNCPSATRGEIENFLLVLDVYESTNNKEKALRAFDMFMNNIITTDPMHALMVNGFFCGLLGKNISLSDNEIEALPKKYSPIIIGKLNNK